MVQVGIEKKYDAEVGEDKKVRVQVTLQEQTRRRFKAILAREGKTAQGFLTETIDNYLVEKEKKE